MSKRIEVEIKPAKDEYKERFFYHLEKVEVFIKEMWENYPISSRIILFFIAFVLFFVTIMFALG